MRLKPLSVVFSIFVAAFACNAAAAPLELENDASVSWANSPNCQLVPALCNPLIVGAPRLVPNMSTAGNRLLFTLDFQDVSVSNFRLRPSLIILNIGDAAGNEVFQPGGTTPLHLSYVVPLSAANPNGPGLLPANDLTVNLGSFTNFGLLPAGALLFTVTLQLDLDLPLGDTFGAGDTRTEAATLYITGPGTTVSVPEPATFVLLLAGLACAALAARWRPFQPASNRT